jgi:hypothetical protein
MFSVDLLILVIVIFIAGSGLSGVCLCFSWHSKGDAAMGYGAMALVFFAGSVLAAGSFLYNFGMKYH